MSAYAQFLPFARETAKAAAAILMDGRFTRKVSTKGFPRDLVTDIDKASEAEIVRRIREAWPEHGIYAEEEVREGLQRDYCWIIDPLDATINYVHGVAFFSVSIGLTHHGRPVLGVVNAPRLAEEYWAVKGGGAYLNGDPIQVSGHDKLMDSIVATGFAYNRNETEDNNADNFVRVLFAVRGTRRCGGASLDLCHVACGRFDGFWELFLAPYDVAAGAAIIREAGGRVTDVAGGDDWLFGNNIVATNGRLHEPLRALLDPFPKTAPVVD